jgi:hypothetical protein
VPATYTAPEIVSRLSPLARDLARVGVLAHADAAKAVAQLRRLGLGYAACRKSRALGAPPVATWSPSSDLGREVAALLGLRVDPPRVAYLPGAKPPAGS